MIEISEIEFLSVKDTVIDEIEIYNLDWILDDNLLDCEGIIIRTKNGTYFIKSQKIGEDDSEFLYYRGFPNDNDSDPRKILSGDREKIFFIGKEVEEGASPLLRFKTGDRHILVTADCCGLTVGLSHWDAEGNWIEYDNTNLLNDK